VAGGAGPPNLWTDDEADDVEPEDETAEVLEEIVPSESAATILKGKAMKRATKSDEHGVSYRDSLGRRRPKTPLQDRMEHMLDSSLPMAIEFLGKFLLEARQRGHQDFPGWIKQATAHHTMLGAVIELAKREPCPTVEDLEALLDPNQQGDPGAVKPEPEP
jgi:hypothetical protein